MKKEYINLDYGSVQKHANLEMLAGKTLLVTGATGMIGYNILSVLLLYNRMHTNKIRLLGMVRDERKAERIYRDVLPGSIKFIIGDITSVIEIPDKIDYIIHCACPTSSKEFVDKPVEVISTTVLGTYNMLNLAQQKHVKGFVFTSTMEVYGSPKTDEKITENHGTDINTMMVRNSYPESKRMCEALCCAFYHEYGVPAKVVRLTQTFGAGVSYEDNRVFADFARCVIEKKNIVLHTKGDTKRSYLYTMDAVSAILLVLATGKSGEAYNAANDETYCSIYEMARLVADHCANGEIEVNIHIEDEKKYGYAPLLKMNLDIQKIKDLGWCATKNLKEMFDILCSSMKETLDDESGNY